MFTLGKSGEIKFSFYGLLLTIATMCLLSCANGGTNTDNNAPVAVIQGETQATTGTAVALDGSLSSDDDGDALTFAWEITSAPQGSSAQLSSATAANTSFTPDLELMLFH